MFGQSHPLVGLGRHLKTKVDEASFGQREEDIKLHALRRPGVDPRRRTYRKLESPQAAAPR
jgi:hypothetical protein